MSGGRRKTRSSAARSANARAQAARINRRRHLMPKCGAHTKSTGEPCADLAMPNGRCFRHGGRTPKGDGWHRPRWPDRNAPDATAKLGRKLKDQAKQAKRKQRRLADMTPDERAAHERWHRSHKPGSAKQPAALREERRQASEARALLSAPPSVTGKRSALADEIAEARAELRERERWLAFADAVANHEGVFG